MKPTFQTQFLEVGCDEAGRGCLAGPVVAAAVILPKKFDPEFLNDSKQLTEKKRNYLRKKIEQEALEFAVGFVTPQEIDEINILNASFLAMHRALNQLQTDFGFIAVDGNRFNTYHEIPHQCCIKGDANYLHIAAASILAKTYRDEFMKKIDKEFPHYQWKTNKGYPTKAHRRGIIANGPCEYHRKSFTLIPPQLSLNFLTEPEQHLERE